MAVNSNAKQSVPKLFLEIMKHDLDEPVVPTPSVGLDGSIAFDTWRRWKTRHDIWRRRQKELIAHAEKTLRWNTDKGNSP